MKYLLILILLSPTMHTFGQVNDSNIRQKVLKLNKVGKEFKFINSKDSTETYLRYLGEIKTDRGVTYKILTSLWIWGMSHRETNRILVFNKHNKYIGEYFLSTGNLPTKIINNNLYFSNLQEATCDPKISTLISFKKGIPKRIFIDCTVKNSIHWGDEYHF